MTIKELKKKHPAKFKRLEKAYKRQVKSDLAFSNWGERSLNQMRKTFGEPCYKSAGDVYITVSKIIKEL